MMDDGVGKAEELVEEIGAIATGLAMSLDRMEDELGVDSRFYALHACINAIVEKSVDAVDALDMLAMTR